MKLLSPEGDLYLCKSTIRSCMEYCCHVCAGAFSCYFELLDQLQKRICRTVGHSLAASLEPLAHRRNVTSLNIFYMYCFGRCSSEPAELVPLPYFRGRSTRYSNRLHDFSVTIRRCYKDVYVKSFFPHTARPWNSPPIECFPLTYDLSGFKSRINRHLLLWILSKQISCMPLHFCASFSHNSMPRCGCSALHGVNYSLKKNT